LTHQVTVDLGIVADLTMEEIFWIEDFCNRSFGDLFTENRKPTLKAMIALHIVSERRKDPKYRAPFLGPGATFADIEFDVVVPDDDDSAGDETGPEGEPPGGGSESNESVNSANSGEVEASR